MRRSSAYIVIHQPSQMNPLDDDSARTKTPSLRGVSQYRPRYSCSLDSPQVCLYPLFNHCSRGKGRRTSGPQKVLRIKKKKTAHSLPPGCGRRRTRPCGVELSRRAAGCCCPSIPNSIGVASRPEFQHVRSDPTWYGPAKQKCNKGASHAETGYSV